MNHDQKSGLGRRDAELAAVAGATFAAAPVLLRRRRLIGSRTARR